MNLQNAKKLLLKTMLGLSMVTLAACGGGATNMTPVEQLPTGSAGPGEENPAPEEVVFNVDAAVLANAGNVACDAPAEEFMNTMLHVSNASRQAARMCGNEAREAAPALQWNDQLAEAARMHAVDMTANNFFAHGGSDGLQVSDRALAAGYSWHAVGENIAAGQIDVAEVQQSWIDSPPHCKNVMNQLFTEIGAACVNGPGADFGDYWVVVFGDAAK